MAATDNMALDLVLRALMSSSEFCETKDKNWVALAALIPQTSAQQCYTRWKELQDMPQSTLNSSSTAPYNNKKLCSLVKSVLHTNRDSDGDVSSGKAGVTDFSPDSSRTKSMTDHLQESFKATENSPTLENKELIPQRVSNRLSLNGRPRSAQSRNSSSTGGLGPNMVIHVCDESKSLKQDFQCPRDLLIQEMRYFAEYLSADAQRWEEVDISVHCDVQIFDWLMRYVKRSLYTNKGEDCIPKLEPTNVISILISSDFLKMDSLVTESIEYCHRNMSAIVATPCNMNCINDMLVTRIAQLFTHSELSDIKDRKDKFKSKLFCKKIEQLFDENFSSPSSPENASTLFKCTACGRLLTASSQKILRCTMNRMTIDKRGHASYSHVRDTSWNVNEYLQSLREKVKSWKEVYWRLWGSVNLLRCLRCEEFFPLYELGHCNYHPMPAEFGTVGIVGTYPCCQQKVLRFDTIVQKSGCKLRDHRVSKEFAVSTMEATKGESSSFTTSSANTLLDNDNEHGTDVFETLEDPKRVAQLQTKQETFNLPSEKSRFTNSAVVIRDLFAHRNSVCVPYERVASPSRAEIDVFGVEETALPTAATNSEPVTKCQIADSVDSGDKKQETSAQLLPSIRRSRSRGMVQRTAAREGRDGMVQRTAPREGRDGMVQRTVAREGRDGMVQRTVAREGRDGKGKNKLSSREEEYVMYEVEDEGESEDAESDRTATNKERTLRQRKVTSASRRDYSTFKSYKWDPQRSARWNQDAQREEDMKRMNELVVYLNKQNKQRVNSPHERQKQKEFVGGIFSKLDYQFRLSQQAQAQPKTQISSTQSLFNQRNRRMMTKS